MANTSRFGNYAIVTPIEHRFEQSPELYLTFRSPTSSDELRVGQYVTKQIKMEGNTPPFRYPNTAEVMLYEIAMLYAGSNIEGAPKPANLPTSELYSGVSPVNDDFVAVYNFLNEMPITMLREVWRHMSDAIPGWGPEKKE